MYVKETACRAIGITANGDCCIDPLYGQSGCCWLRCPLHEVLGLPDMCILLIYKVAIMQMLLNAQAAALQ